MNRRFGILGAFAVATVFLFSAGPAVSGDGKGVTHKDPLAGLGLDGADVMSDSELGGVSGDTAKSSGRQGAALNEQDRQAGLAGRTGLTGRSGAPEVSGAVSINDVTVAAPNHFPFHRY